MYPRHGYEWHGNQLRGGGCFRANGLRNSECRDPLKWILFAALMTFGSERESPTAEIRNFIIRQNRNCKTQSNKPSQNNRVNAASAASVRLRNLGRQRFLRAISNVIHLPGLKLHLLKRGQPCIIT